MKNIAIFASGSGTNAQNIADYFKDSPDVSICRIYSNRKDAYVLERAYSLRIPTFVFNRDDLYKSDIINNQLEKDNTSLIVLAGFLWLVPESLIKLYHDRIINIHPALLPQYGGKGMFGHHVHAAVLESKDKESGITIHFVNEHYDDGQIIFKAKCPVYDDDNPDTLASRIHKLEYEYYPKVISKLVNKL
ncbi:MAG: phosphoribosylglycinamide formyltransferase [Bacteroidales bacterium]|nr:phosphoribosylglycinamide formyltransferase [Bacteroidales bacterium]